VPFILCAANIDSLYYVCDDGEDLWRIHRTNGGTTYIGALGGGTGAVEAIAYWPGTETLYATDAGNFGTISKTTGAWNFIANVDAAGNANGSEGAQAFGDIDGLSFDPWTGILWASARRSGDYDLLFQIDHTTGQYIQNAFGPNVDYLVIDGSGVFTDIDDIAISPVNGTMYTVSTQGGSAQIISINKYTGDVTVSSSCDRGDIEGLAYHNDGSFWGTVGASGSPANTFVQINVNTGVTSGAVSLTDANCGDTEALASLVADINLVNGTIYDDLDLDGVLDAGEPGIQGVTVNLYYDKDGNGTYSATDILIQTQSSDVNGNYSFPFATTADLLIITDFSTYPSGYAFTTDNIEIASFNSFGQIDQNNNFGVGTGTDSDLDGLPDFYETTTADTDIDGVPDYLDLDSDNDGILDADEGSNDKDGDGIPNYLDLDSDNDGIPDAIEANGGVYPVDYVNTIGRIVGNDADGDGLLDGVDNAPNTAYTGASTSLSGNPDTDGDGINDYLDLDADNDGILDLVEGGGSDTDGNGTYDNFSDANGDGYFDGANLNYLSVPNADISYENTNGLSELPDYLDLDSDNDGLIDTREGFPTDEYPVILINQDSDNDGIIDRFDIGVGGTPAAPEDTDGDGIPDFNDPDADGDGISDAIEANDADLNGVADSSPSGSDTDGDGIDDNFDSDINVWGGDNSVLPETNQDGDGQPDWRDLDNLGNPGIFYYVCDGSDQLYSYNVFDGTSTLIGGAGVPDIEAIAYWDGVLYGADAGDFGILNTTTGGFSIISEIDGGGTANGSAGAQQLNDVDGLSFDPWTGILWASSRRNGNYDLLFQIDPSTGQYVPDAFGTNVDYLIVDGSGVFNDVDDIAVSPADGELYTVGNDGTNDQLLNINKYTGTVTVVGALSDNDIEGMAYFNDATFYGTKGNSPSDFYEIDPSNGNLSGNQVLACNDVEAVAALVAPPNKVSGTVFDDADLDQVQGGTETGIANVTVNLFYDVDGDGQVGVNDILIQSEVTDANGDYEFTFATTANLVMQIDAATLPAGYALTTDNIESAVFTDNINFNETDLANNFGATTDSDCDGDGIPDFAEGGVGVDFDGDGIDNMCDLDSDNDGILDNIEGTEDTDADGHPDYLDLDTDNDGIPDAIEANDGVAIASYQVNDGFLSGTDTDGDGLIDAVDSDPSTPYGSSSSTFNNQDHDGDGLLDSEDLDSDNDGILDIIEAGGVDSDNNGQVDGFTDGNNNGLSDNLQTNPLSIPNTDGNGNPDYIDIDSDDDGLDDTVEGLSTANYGYPTTNSDADGDGIIDFFDSNLGGSPITPVDTDNDGTPDYQDLDSDNDAVSDIIEGNDANADGVADVAFSGVDADGDGLDDAFDPGCTGSTPNFSSFDYAEEDVNDNSIDLGSSDLELTYDGNQQEVGILFNNVSIPQGTTINSAYLQFEADESHSGSLTILIDGELAANASSYTSTAGDVSSRSTTSGTNQVSWSPNAWTAGDAGADQRTPDISAIIQEIVNQGTWTSGNNLGFIITGSGTNRRTAETSVQLVIDFGSGANSWGCETSLPHQDFNSDGEDDWRDIDDDGDGINTINETADIDANGTPDYLEISPCPAGFTLATVNGNADAVVASNLVTNPNNALGAPDGNIVTYQGNNSSRVDLDFTDQLSGGDSFDVTWRKISGGGDAELEVFYSLNGTSGWTSITVLATSSTSLVTSTVTVPNGVSTQYFRLQRDRRVPGLDGISYTVTGCQSDKDMDGIIDSQDEDDDNDGISDIAEGGTADFDGDGIPNSCDLDSDNDGIPDAVEANGGDLPAGMVADGYYPAAAIVANDVDGDGWFETSEGGANYSNSTAILLNTDGTGNADFLDLDADDDCVPDAVEANEGVLPSNMDDNGQYPIAYATANDADGDGQMDDIDSDNGGSPLTNGDEDGDGEKNYIDTDADGDGIVDGLEAFDPDITMSGNDADGDGLDDACDPDAGNPTANMPDEDCNGIFDYLDAGARSNQTGSYTSGNTWAGNVVPTAGKSILIQSNHEVTLTGNTVVGSLTVEPNAIFNLGGFELTVLGNFTVNGTFNHGNGKVKFSGSCTQTICGVIDFYDLETDNASGVSMECGDITIENEWILEEGIVDVCNAPSVTLVSSSTEQGYISGTGAGTVDCEVIRERYKLGCQDGFMLLCSPYTGNTYNDWADDFLMTGFPGTQFPSFWESVYLYEESVSGVVDSGFYAPSSINANIPRGNGHYVYIGTYQLPNTIDVEGEPILNDFTFDINYTNSGLQLHDGYNLLGNPYPSPIDWDNSSAWVNVGCCDAIWYWDECSEQYASYISQVATNGGTNIVESCQSFWIKAHVPGSSLTISRDAMSSDNGDFKLLGNQAVDAVLGLHIDGFAKEDETKLRMLSGANHGHDDEGDALKMISAYNNMGIYTIDDMGMDLSINAFPPDGQSKIIPVMVRVPETGSYVLDMDGAASFPDEVCILLEDKVTGDIMDMKATTFYNFTMDSLPNFENRFDIIMEYPVEVETHNATCAGASDAFAVFNPNGVGPYDIMWEDENGNVVQFKNGINWADTLSGVADGIYTLTVIDQGVTNCANNAVQFEISSPDAGINITDQLTHVACNQAALGAININVIGGTSPYTYQWDNGATTQDLSNLAVGSYELTVSDANGCTSIVSYDVLDGNNVTANFNVPDTLNLFYQAAAVTFNNLSLGSNSQVWFVDDSVTTSYNLNYEFTQTGMYEIKLIAVNAGCTDTISKEMVVIDSPNTIGENLENAVSVFENNGVVELNFLSVMNNVAVSVYDAKGSLIAGSSLGRAEGLVRFDLTEEATGIYLITIESAGKMFTTKVRIQ
jgi:hypothetical protein